MDDIDFNNQILKSYIEEYKESQTNFIIKLVIFYVNGISFLYYGRIFPVLDVNKAINEEILKYNDCIYYQGEISSNEFEELYDRLKNPFREQFDRSIFYAFNLLKDFKIHSGQLMSLEKREYDKQWIRNLSFNRNLRTIFTIRFPGQNTKVSLNTTDISLPYYPSIRSLILHKFHFDINRFSTNNELHIALTPKAILTYIEQKEDKIIFSVKNDLQLSLTLKVFAEKSNTECEIFNFNIEKTKHIGISNEYKEIKVILVDQNGIILDTRVFYNKTTTKSEEIERLILDGESETVDFKIWDNKNKDPSKKEKFVRLLTAFANANGGKILFGVDNDTTIKGIENSNLDEIDQFLTNLCEEKTRPRVLVTKGFVEINKMLVGVFTVNKSNDLIQDLYDKHIYVRRGSTNRPITPNELKSRSKGF